MKIRLSLALVVLIAVSCSSKKEMHALPFEEKAELVVVQQGTTSSAQEDTTVQPMFKTSSVHPVGETETAVSTAVRTPQMNNDPLAGRHTERRGAVEGRYGERGKAATSADGRYHIIVGSFLNPDYADIMCNRLKQEGYSCVVLPFRYTNRVSIANFDNEQAARNELQRLRKGTQHRNAWLLIE